MCLVHTEHGFLATRNVNHVPGPHGARLPRHEPVYQAVYTAVLRLLAGDLPPVFLCHTKRGSSESSAGDGERIARELRRYINDKTQLPCFFDVHDIPHGHGVKESIEGAIGGSIVLAVWTDRFLDSPWCQHEIIEARRRQRPILVLDALATSAPRLFPFLANMPVVRWQRDRATVVSSILLEAIRAQHLRAIFDSLHSPGSPHGTFGLHAPDLLATALASGPTASTIGPAKGGARHSRTFVYPDPPIKPGELKVLRDASSPSTNFLSLLEWHSLGAAEALRERHDERSQSPLAGLRVGISVSESETWADLGLIGLHQGYLARSIALELILLGSKVIWAGDLRADGLGDQLRRIVQTYHEPQRPPQDHVGVYVPFSVGPKRLKKAELRALRRLADVQQLGRPLSSTDVWSFPSKPDSATGRALSAFALSTMRDMLAATGCEARVLLGGKMAQFAGLYPGLAEEAFAAVRRGQPLYALGGFGGAARLVYDAIVGVRAARAQLIDASRTFGAASNPEVRREHARLIEVSGKRELGFAPEAMVKVLSDLGPDGLAKRNGLSIEENERLAESQNVHEVLGLLVKGLVKTGRSALSGRPGAQAPGAERPTPGSERKSGS